jgi:hypothetical protein
LNIFGLNVDMDVDVDVEGKNFEAADQPDESDLQSRTASTAQYNTQLEQVVVEREEEKQKQK